MLKGLFGSGGATVQELVARRKYGKAAELLREQIAARPGDHRLRNLLADVLIQDGRKSEALQTLGPLVNLYVDGGDFVRAIAMLKKMQKVDPGEAAIEKKLAHVMRLKGGTADAAPAAGAGTSGGQGSFTTEIYGEIGAEELGLAAAIESSPDPGAPPGEERPAPAALAADFHDASGKTALFGEFREEELAEVIAGLNLRSFEPGDIIVTQGEPGDSLFVLTSGMVKAFVRNPSHHNMFLREMGEGTFFGEVSVLSGRPRTATITAATPCELLELDRKALDSIASRHPNVREVLRQFYERRSGSAEELAARRSEG